MPTCLLLFLFYPSFREALYPKLAISPIATNDDARRRDESKGHRQIERRKNITLFAHQLRLKEGDTFFLRKAARIQELNPPWSNEIPV
jgi:hypothetical protein